MVSIASAFRRPDEASARGSVATGALRRALLDTLPIIAVLVPFATVLGGAIAEADIDGFAGWLGAPLLFAGSAHLATVALLDGGAAATVVLLSVGVINSRFMLYSAALSRGLREQPRWFRWVAPHFLVDQLYVLVAEQIERGARPEALRWYYLGVAALLAGAWLPAVALGIWLGPIVPESWPLGFTVPVLFIGMLVPGVRSRPELVAATVAVTVAIAAGGLPHGLGLIAGAGAGIAAGRLVPSREAAVAVTDERTAT